MSDSVRPHRRQPTRLPHPWDSSGKNTSGLPFPSPMHEVKSESEVAQSCPTLCDPMDCSLPGSSVHGIFQARVVEWGAIAFSILSKDSFNFVHLLRPERNKLWRPRDQQCQPGLLGVAHPRMAPKPQEKTKSLCVNFQEESAEGPTHSSPQPVDTSSWLSAARMLAGKDPNTHLGGSYSFL